jgi:hypothetical protein
MKRDRLRKQGPRIQDQITFRGFKAVILENRWLRILILPEKGSDIIEFLYKPLDLDLLWRAPTGFWQTEYPYAGDLTIRNSFIDYYPGGWQEIMPNGGPGCIYKGAKFDEHGETPLLPWIYQVIEDNDHCVTLRLSTRTLRIPLYIEKEISIGKEPALFLTETVTNIGAEPLAVMWGHHPALGAPFIDGGCFIDLPECHGISHPVERFQTQRLYPDKTFTWPMAPGRDGKPVDLSCVQPPGAGTADLVYLIDLPEAWFAITNPGLRVHFGMAWTPETFKHIWLWHDANGSMGYPWYSQGYVLALEPWSSYPSMGLAEAVSRNTHMILQPGEVRHARLAATVSNGFERVRQVTLDGEVKT